jgi:CRP/FNR family cyclic AMP-dependent transcriptional regulator
VAANPTRGHAFRQLFATPSAVPIAVEPYYDRAVRLGRNAKVDLLRSVPLFAGCSKTELRELATTADEIDLRAGHVLTREGRPGREFFVLVDGTVRVTKDGKEIAELSGGDWFGEIALLTKVPRTATVTATSDVRALVVTDRAFRRLVETMPSIALKVLASVGERLEHDAKS